MTYPSVGGVTYAFSPAGRLSTVTDWASRASSYTYFASGLTHTVTLPSALGRVKLPRLRGTLGDAAVP